MKKQFNRMRQLANQTVGRAEKTEVLSEDLLQIEKRMDAIRIISHNTHKRLAACLQVQQGTEVEKRHKKLQLMALSQSMQEGITSLGDDSLIVKLLETCTEAENKLAFELASYESQIERDILDPFSNLAEMEIPNIQKQRKQLAKLVLDWDSAKMRYNQAHKAAFSGANFPAVAAKIDSLREEMDEAGNKVELCKDQLAADMYNFISKEGDYARYFVTLLEAQADYHRKSLAVLERVLPTIQTQQDTWTEKPAFGTALEEHLKRSSREIALPIEACVMMLLETGMKEEGLFRIAAGASKLKKLKAALDCSTSQLEEFYSDQHAVAGALKSYLRELPEPLMTFQLYDEWVQAASVPESDKKLQALWVTCSKMPKLNSSNFRYLIKFLSKLAQNSEINKMTPSNIAIVLGPNLLWAKNEGTLADMAAATSVHVVTIIEPIIQHADWFFPDDLDFNVSGMFTPMTPANHLNNLSFTGGDYDSSTLERKRPVSVGVVEDLLKKDSLSKTKDVASPPPSVRNETSTASAGQSQSQPTGTGPNQLNVAAGPITTGPSPHIIRRATKKPAPAPPKPSNPPPGQPLGHGTNQPANQASSHSPKQPNQVAGQPGNRSPVQSHGQSFSQPTIQPRRHSSNQMVIHAPSHPPPQPPPQPINPYPIKAPCEQGMDQSSNSPPGTPTPPNTPPLGAHSASFHLTQHSMHSHVFQANQDLHSLPPQFATLPRARPVPKPRSRPNVPPPPQPPVVAPATNCSIPAENASSNVASTASKIVTDFDSTVQEQDSNESKSPVELMPDAGNMELGKHEQQDIDDDSESTAL
ncbi:rho GTPase-activating protein 17a isoform X6 [Scyliorhinus canicula]|uniref:rho GTPase-activating protein 17a isoform X6 n=1 Tax=Scyliorhinus canicula TaxID=7830 RepID=UPI0018F3D8BB|nr:rho GTPase-activating protein 17a isoform X6 [Scyliorhinus canicula]